MKLLDLQNFLVKIDLHKNIMVFTDGACSGNPGPGGWGALVNQGEYETELSGGELATTNNRMELASAINAIGALPDGALITITTDSQYLKNGIELWIHQWAKNGWKTSSGNAVKNQDMWLDLDSACRSRSVSWRWVKGHNGCPENERADILSKQAVARTILLHKR
jgi:ribonuclease HI